MLPVQPSTKRCNQTPKSATIRQFCVVTLHPISSSMGVSNGVRQPQDKFEKVRIRFKTKKWDCRKRQSPIFTGCARQGNNSVVKVRYALASRNREPKARVSAVRRNLKGAGCQSKELRQASSRTDDQEPHSRPHRDGRVCQTTKVRCYLNPTPASALDIW